MTKQRPRRVTPTAENGTVPPRRKRNEELRPRDYLTPAEIERLMKKAGDNRYGHRDATMVLIAYRHGLRPTEACELKWDNLDLDRAKMHVSRVKNGTPSVHPLSGAELRALRWLKRGVAGIAFRLCLRAGRAKPKIFAASSILMRRRRALFQYSALIRSRTQVQNRGPISVKAAIGRSNGEPLSRRWIQRRNAPAIIDWEVPNVPGFSGRKIPSVAVSSIRMLSRGDRLRFGCRTFHLNRHRRKP